MSETDDFEGMVVEMEDQPIEPIDADGVRTTERVYRDEPVPPRKEAGDGEGADSK